MTFKAGALGLCLGTLSVVSAASLKSAILQVAIPNWAVGLECILVSGVSTVPAIQSGQLIVSCDTARGVLSCNGANVEPLDMAVADACATGTLPLSRAVTAPAEFPAEETVSISWLDISQTAEVTLIASRLIAGPTTVPLLVAAKNTRILTFSRPDVSPVSIDAVSLLKENWRLPPPRPGGEFIGIRPRSSVEPISYNVSGPRSLILEARGSTVLVASGIAPGNYEVEPVYQGGLTGAKTRVDILDKKSAVVLLNPEPVGAAEITADPSACLQPTLHVSALASGPSTIRSEVLQLPADVGCHWAVAGLPAGFYEASVTDATGYGGMIERFSVLPQQSTVVTLSAPDVRVSGQVLLNRKPLSNVALDFIAETSTSRGSVNTDADGHYSVILAKAGRYRAMLGGMSSPWEIRSFDASAGATVLDWDLVKGEIAVQVSGGRQHVPTTIYLQSRDTSRFEILPAGTPAVTIRAMAFGQYKVWASQEEGGHTLVSPALSVVLDVSNATRQLDLELSENQATLTLVNAEGNPIPDARLLPMRPEGRLQPIGAHLLHESSPGVYSLSSLFPGISLVIVAKGYVPTCKIVPKNETIVARLERGRRVDIQFPRDVTTPAIQVVALAGFEGTECAVPLRFFNPISSGSVSPPIVTIENFPSSHRLMLIRPGSARPIYVSDSGPVIVERH